MSFFNVNSIANSIGGMVKGLQNENTTKEILNYNEGLLFHAPDDVDSKEIAKEKVNDSLDFFKNAGGILFNTPDNECANGVAEQKVDNSFDFFKAAGGFLFH